MRRVPPETGLPPGLIIAPQSPRSTLPGSGAGEGSPVSVPGTDVDVALAVGDGFDESSHATRNAARQRTRAPRANRSSGRRGIWLPPPSHDDSNIHRTHPVVSIPKHF